MVRNVTSPGPCYPVGSQAGGVWHWLAGRSGGGRPRMGDLHRFVSDELHGLLGISESTLVDYVVALAKRSKDEAVGA